MKIYYEKDLIDHNAKNGKDNPFKQSALYTKELAKQLDKQKKEFLKICRKHCYCKTREGIFYGEPTKSGYGLCSFCFMKQQLSDNPLPKALTEKRGEKK